MQIRNSPNYQFVVTLPVEMEYIWSLGSQAFAAVPAKRNPQRRPAKPDREARPRSPKQRAGTTQPTSGKLSPTLSRTIYIYANCHGGRPLADSACGVLDRQAYWRH